MSREDVHNYKEAIRLLDILYDNPQKVIKCESQVAKKMRLHCKESFVYACKVYEVRFKSLGLGVYQVSCGVVEHGD